MNKCAVCGNEFASDTDICSEKCEEQAERNVEEMIDILEDCLDVISLRFATEEHRKQLKDAFIAYAVVRKLNIKID